MGQYGCLIDAIIRIGLFIGSSRSTQSLIRISPKYVCFAYVLLLLTATLDDLVGRCQPHDAEESESECILQKRNIKPITQDGQ